MLAVGQQPLHHYHVPVTQNRSTKRTRFSTHKPRGGHKPLLPNPSPANSMSRRPNQHHQMPRPMNPQITAQYYQPSPRVTVTVSNVPDSQGNGFGSGFPVDHHIPARRHRPSPRRNLPAPPPTPFRRRIPFLLITNNPIQ